MPCTFYIIVVLAAGEWTGNWRRTSDILSDRLYILKRTRQQRKEKRKKKTRREKKHGSRESKQIEKAGTVSFSFHAH